MAHTEETKRKIAESVKRGHALNPRKTESLEKISASLRLAHAEGRAGGYHKGNKLALLRSRDDLQRCARIAQQSCIGKHGFGKMYLGRPDHNFAKSWIFESPEGEQIECNNLLEWCRQNEHRFPPDDQQYRQPLWHRAAMGIGRQASTKDPRSHWHGWILVQVGNNTANGRTD